MSDADAHTHRYEATVGWSGSTALGYDHYDRGHVATAPPANTLMSLSSDPAFLGDQDRLNPEQLLTLAAASCQLLSFLAVAARARIDVVAYDDHAEAEMPEGERPTRIARINLRPHIVLRAGPDGNPLVSDERLQQLVEVAHRECYIANSVNSEITVRPTFEHRELPTAAS